MEMNKFKNSEMEKVAQELKRYMERYAKRVEEAEDKLEAEKTITGLYALVMFAQANKFASEEEIEKFYRPYWEMVYEKIWL